MFTLVYGTIAAHNHRAEQVMMPVLDVLQAIPVLGFLPRSLAMIACSRRARSGWRSPAIVMIFTGAGLEHGVQLPRQPPRHSASPARGRGGAALGGWQTFRLLEVPAAMIGLVWNSMMSMAGGWFFLTVNEAFTLGNRDFRLPGIGSYMNEAINRRRHGRPMIARHRRDGRDDRGVDQLFWRPIVVWSQRFKLEDTPTPRCTSRGCSDCCGNRLCEVIVSVPWDRIRGPKGTTTVTPLSNRHNCPAGAADSHGV